MDPIIFESLGGLLVGAMVAATVVLRAKYPSPKTMPILEIRKRRSIGRARRRKACASTTGRRVSLTRAVKKAKAKTIEATTESSQTPSIVSETAVSFETCPSCGLQAPGSLLAEHFLGSPSHRIGPPKTAETDSVEVEVDHKADEEDSKQSVRNLLQMLVPPRAFGRRHEHKSVSPVSSIVKELGPQR